MSVEKDVVGRERYVRYAEDSAGVASAGSSENSGEEDNFDDSARRSAQVNVPHFSVFVPYENVSPARPSSHWGERGRWRDEAASPTTLLSRSDVPSQKELLVRPADEADRGVALSLSGGPQLSVPPLFFAPASQPRRRGLTSASHSLRRDAPRTVESSLATSDRTMVELGASCEQNAAEQMLKAVQKHKNGPKGLVAMYLSSRTRLRHAAQAKARAMSFAGIHPLARLDASGATNRKLFDAKGTGREETLCAQKPAKGRSQSCPVTFRARKELQLENEFARSASFLRKEHRDTRFSSSSVTMLRSSESAPINDMYQYHLAIRSVRAGKHFLTLKELLANPHLNDEDDEEEEEDEDDEEEEDDVAAEQDEEDEVVCGKC